MANKIIIKKSSVAAKIPLSTDLQVGEIAGNLEDQKLYSKKPDGTVVLMGSGLGGTGDVVGPSSATNGAVALFDGTTGKLIANGQVPGSIYTQDANNVNIDGGAIDGTPIGNTTASTGDFTDLAYTGTLTGGTGVINIGSGQVYKDAVGKLGVGTIPNVPFEVASPSSQVRFTDTDDNKFVEFSYSSDRLAIRNNSASADHIWLSEGGQFIASQGITLGTTGGTYNAANTLDDYETGLFNPSLFDTTTGSNFSTQANQGRYVKIGNFVFVTVRLFNASTTGSTNDVGMRLPFTVGDNRNQPVNILMYSVSFGGAVSAFIIDGTNFVRFSKVLASISNNVDCNEVGSGLRGYFSIAYSTI